MIVNIVLLQRAGYFPDSVWNIAKSSGALSPPMTVLQLACAKVKSSRETRNNLLVNWLNEVLGKSSPLAKYYFKDAAAKSAYTPVEVEAVARWAKDFASLMEPTSLGRPHFSKYLGSEKGVNMDLVFGPRSGSGRGVLTSDGQYCTLYAADVLARSLAHSLTHTHTSIHAHIHSHVGDEQIPPFASIHGDA